MILGKKLQLGRKISDITVGDKFSITEKVEDRDILLYLGLTNDTNPLYLHHDYASRTSFKRPLVPPTMLLGIVISAVTKYFPGPGSYVKQQAIDFIRPVYHFEMIQLTFEVVKTDKENELVEMNVEGQNEKGEKILEGNLSVCPPEPIGELDGSVLDNFY